MPETFGARVADAVRFAVEHHVEPDGSSTLRKGSSVPYLSHLLAVCALVIEAGGDETMAVAAVLHDTLEDTGVGRDGLAAAFGDEVAELVEGCSDGVRGQLRDASTWRERKAAYVEHLAHAPRRVAVISAADKLHNATSIVVDAEADAADESRPSVWGRFNAPPGEILWYYRAVVGALEPELAGTPLLRRLEQAVARLHELAPA